jgi:hypothetical protein
MAPKFGDFGKDASDLLKDDFSTDNKFEYKTVTGDGVTFTPSLTQTCKGVVGAFSAKFSPLKAANSTFKVDTANKMSLETKYDVASHLQLNSTVTASPNFGVKVGADYNSGFFAASANFDALANSVCFNATTGADACNFWAGVSGGFSAASGLSDMKTALEYKGKDFTVAAGSDLAFASMKASYFHKVRSNFIVGAEFCHCGKGDQFSMAAKTTNGASKKIRLSSSGEVGLSYACKVADGTNLTIASVFDAVNGGAAPRVGFQVNMQ